MEIGAQNSERKLQVTPSACVLHAVRFSGVRENGSLVGELMRKAKKILYRGHLKFVNFNSIKAKLDIKDRI